MDDPVTPVPDAATPGRRSFGGLGRLGATAAVAAGLAVGGGIGGFVVTQAATPSPNASPGVTAPASPGATSPHPCPGHSGSGTPSGSAFGI